MDLISDKTIVVLGYSCFDDFDILPLLAESNPKSVIWLNFDSNEHLSKLSKDITNNKIFDVSKKISILYFNGRLVPFFIEWGNKCSFTLCEGEKEHQFTIKDYILQLYETQTKKNILCNEIFLS